MSDLLQQNATWLDDKRARYMAHTVTYARGQSLSVSVLAMLGKTVFEQVDEFGGLRRTEARDYLITATSLVLGGSVVEPQAGDRITDGVLVCEVMAPGGEPPWRYSDGYRKTLRIHTKVVSHG